MKNCNNPGGDCYWKGGMGMNSKYVFVTLPPIIMEVKNGCISNSSYLSTFKYSHFPLP